jgi:chaperonin GroEL (HSP60 family)
LVVVLHDASTTAEKKLSEDQHSANQLQAFHRELFLSSSNVKKNEIANVGQDGGIVVGHVLELKEHYGFNAMNDNYEAMVAAGVVDATKVFRSALPCAASVSAQSLACGAIISNSSRQG